MTEDSSTSENQSRTPRKASELEEQKRKDDLADSARCALDVRIDERGNVEVVGVGKSCPRILTELPAIRKEFWLRRAKPRLRRQIEEQRSEESAQQEK